jgi:hypothetical protein
MIKRYFTDVYLFCLHKDPKDHSKLRPLGITTAIWQLIATHVARILKSKFASHLLPYNYTIGIPNGMSFVVKAMQLAIKKFIDAPQQAHCSPTRAAVFFNLTNQFNSVSHSNFFSIIAEHFPEILPLTTLFYSNANTVHHKWSNGTWHQLLMEEGVTQGCPLSPLFASFVVARLLEPINALLHARAAERLASGNPGNDEYGSITHLVSYVDNISTCIYLPDLKFFCNTLKTNGAALGCFINMTKTKILTSCNGMSPLLLIFASNPKLGLSIANTIATFLTTPHPTDTTAPAIPVELTHGFCLIEHPVGSTTFANKFFTKCISVIKNASFLSTTPSLTNKQSLVSSSNASSRRSHTSSHLTCFTTYQPTTLTPLGRSGMAHSQTLLTRSYNLSYKCF